MLMHNLFGENLLDDFFRMPSFKEMEKSAQPHGLMSTDVKEKDNGYEILMNLPGYKKEDIQAELKDGYLTISAESHSENDEKGDDGKYIRKERYYGSCSRSFFVGNDLSQEDIKGKFEDGVLTLSVPKVSALPEKEKQYIAIEG